MIKINMNDGSDSYYRLEYLFCQCFLIIFCFAAYSPDYWTGNMVRFYQGGEGNEKNPSSTLYFAGAATCLFFSGGFLRAVFAWDGGFQRIGAYGIATGFYPGYGGERLFVRLCFWIPLFCKMATPYPQKTADKPPDIFRPSGGVNM